VARLVPRDDRLLDNGPRAGRIAPAQSADWRHFRHAEASMFARREDRSRAITISANGTHVGDINGLSPPTQHLRFDPHTAIEDDNRLALTIDVPKPVMSADRKQRGLHLTRLTLSS
jgi:hypothetical protein